MVAVDDAMGLLGTRMSWLRAKLLLTLLLSSSVRAQEPSPYAIDIPRWFATTFLDFASASRIVIGPRNWLSELSGR